MGMWLYDKLLHTHSSYKVDMHTGDIIVLHAGTQCAFKKKRFLGFIRALPSLALLSCHRH